MTDFISPSPPTHSDSDGVMDFLYIGLIQNNNNNVTEYCLFLRGVKSVTPSLSIARAGDGLEHIRHYSHLSITDIPCSMPNSEYFPENNLSCSLAACANCPHASACPYADSLDSNQANIGELEARLYD